MMKQLTCLLMAAVLLLAACQKEIDWGLGSGGVTADQLLVKILSKTGTDSTVVTYSYNSAKQLIRETTIGSSGTNSLDNDLRITRNSAGIIQKTVQVASELIANGIDSLVIRYNYNSALSRYSSSVFNVTVMGTNVTDSVVYVYDASGKITSDAHYLKASILPLPVLSLRNQYTYSADGLNLTGAQQFASTTPGGPLSLQASQSYTYDSKKNPLIIKQEAILLTRPGLFNAQNTLSTLVTNTTDPTTDFAMDYVYRYNLAGKPDSSYATRTPGGAVTASKYFYQ
jgi:YD repeat-containing protein